MIQSDINRTPVEKQPELPMLMICDKGDTIVLITDIATFAEGYVLLGTGTCVAISPSNKFNKVGDYAKSWDINNFRPFVGKIQLYNK